MKFKIIESFKILIGFVKNPIAWPMERMDINSQIVLASVVAFVAIGISALSQIIGGSYFMVNFIAVGIALLFCPLIGLMIVYIQGGILHLFLKYLVSPVIKSTLDDPMAARQIATFASFSLIVAVIPGLTIVTLIINSMIEAIGLNKLLKLKVSTSVAIAVTYGLIWWGIGQLLWK